MDRISHRAAVLAAATLTLVACAHGPDAAPPAAPLAPAPVSTTQTTSQVVAAPQPQPTLNVLNVSDKILKACKLDFGNIDTAPKFSFDQSDLRSDERELLQKVAACATTGPLKGQSLQLMGRADPRGETEYNFVLGESRASSVRTYLMGLGLDGSRISTTSRGKLDATGTDEAGWQLDRRVDVDLR
jgi:peptidoglycan-associated lipoprotein